MSFLKYTILVSLFTLPALASDLNLDCTITHDFKEVLSTSVVLHTGEHNLQFGEYQQFRFFLSDNSSKENNKTELQVFDGSTPSRSYAVADLTKSDSIELSNWTRDYLLTAICKKH